MPYEIKDSGERTVFSSGACRDMSVGKGNFAVLPASAILRLTKLYEMGMRKYGARNYLKGIPVTSFIDSALRHLFKYLAGEDDEDHLSSAVFNILGIMEMEENHPDMCDLETRIGKNKFPYHENKEGSNNENNVDPNF